MKHQLITALTFCMTIAACGPSQQPSEASAAEQDSLSMADSSRAHNAEALQHMAQLLNEPYDSAAFAAHCDYIMNWAQGSRDIDVNIDEQIGELMGTPYLMGYIAACAESQLQDGEPSMNWPRFIKSMKRLTAFYRQNRDVCGTAPRLERYAVLDSMQLADTLRVDFRALIGE